MKLSLYKTRHAYCRGSKTYACLNQSPPQGVGGFKFVVWVNRLRITLDLFNPNLLLIHANPLILAINFFLYIFLNDCYNHNVQELLLLYSCLAVQAGCPETSSQYMRYHPELAEQGKFLEYKYAFLKDYMIVAGVLYDRTVNLPLTKTLGANITANGGNITYTFRF
jgi:hypothetical protein